MSQATGLVVFLASTGFTKSAVVHKKGAKTQLVKSDIHEQLLALTDYTKQSFKLQSLQQCLMC